jgi:hypothetical protein
MGIVGNCILVCSLLSVSNIESMSCFLLMSSFIQGVLGEKIVVCLFLVGTSSQSVSNMGVVGNCILVCGLLSVSNIKTVCSILFVSSFAQGMLGEKIVVSLIFVCSLLSVV